MESESILSTIWRITKIGLPSTINIMSFQLIGTINLLFISKFGDSAMISGVGNANMFINITAISILVGLNSALATFVS